MDISPVVTGTSPEMELKMVVFPAPFGPIKPTMELLGTSR